jgi:hypothetical protein
MIWISILVNKMETIFYLIYEQVVTGDSYGSNNSILELNIKLLILYHIFSNTSISCTNMHMEFQECSSDSLRTALIH